MENGIDVIFAGCICVSLSFLGYLCCAIRYHEQQEQEERDRRINEAVELEMNGQRYSYPH